MTDIIVSFWCEVQLIREKRILLSINMFDKNLTDILVHVLLFTARIENLGNFFLIRDKIIKITTYVNKTYIYFRYEQLNYLVLHLHIDDRNRKIRYK